MGSSASKKQSSGTDTAPPKTAGIQHDINFLKTIGLGKGDIPDVEQLKKMWGYYDKDKDAKMTKTEFESYFKDFCGQMEVQYTAGVQAQASTMFNELDTNKDGVLSFEEFTGHFDVKSDPKDLVEEQ